MLDQILYSLRTVISSIPTTIITKSIVQKSLNHKNESLEGFIHSLNSEEFDLLVELVYIRINVIDAVERFGMFMEQWCHLVTVWNHITNYGKYHTALIVQDGKKVIYAEAIEFLCKEWSQGKRLGKMDKVNNLTKECMNANWRDITASGSVEILHKEKRNNEKEKLVITLSDDQGSMYVASLTKKASDRSGNSWNISRIKKSVRLTPLHPYKKCRFCDKHHYIGECHFSSQSKKGKIAKELYHELRVKELLA